MWLIFLMKFNAFFSTDKIIDETNEKVKDLIKSINSNAARSIELIDDRIKQLKSVSAEAERRIGVLKRELSLAEKSKSFQKKINSVTSLKNSDIQGDLFFTEKARTELGIKPSSPPSGEVELRKIPVVEPELFMAENPIVPEKDFKTKVRELRALGIPADEIARKTGRSIQEVKLVIEIL
ncbi:hypothetical protein [Treponema sp.]|uniref:hypothetical protein n=1 Tax=Treponema sp. TaxID=166 RepID=UPI003F10A21B